MLGISGKTAKWLSTRLKLEKVSLFILMVVAAFLVFHNLKFNPRPWHDEGSALSVPKTLVEDGVYAGKSSDGYQTFGAVQSVGPTLLLPVALSFKFFGIGLVQGRIVGAIYALLALFAFYALGRELFGWQTAFLSAVILLGSPAARFLFYGRQVLGEVPAFGFFLSGWLAWLQGERSERRWLYLIAGLLIGMAMVTKSSYIFIGFATIASLLVLDLFVYRQRKTAALMLTGLMALICVMVWTGWQWVYFGADTFYENVAKLRQLADSTTGFNLPTTVAALKFLVGAESGHFYYWWGFPSLIYVGLLSLRRDHRSLTLASLLNFSLFWLGYYLLWSVPWVSYIFAPAATSALFVGKLWYDLLSSIRVSWGRILSSARLDVQVEASLKLAATAALGLMILYPFQSIVRLNVLHQDHTPYQVAAFLNERVDPDSIVETWERELGVLTDHRYHFPDQALLARTHAAIYRGGLYDYALGADYFQRYRPSYLVVGWFARWTGIYDANFLAEHGELLTTIGEYEIYELHLP